VKEMDVIKSLDKGDQEDITDDFYVADEIIL
jgi:hypothetical protein